MRLIKSWLPAVPVSRANKPDIKAYAGGYAFLHILFYFSCNTEEQALEG